MTQMFNEHEHIVPTISKSEQLVGRTLRVAMFSSPSSIWKSKGMSKVSPRDPWAINRETGELGLQLWSDQWCGPNGEFYFFTAPEVEGVSSYLVPLLRVLGEGGTLTFINVHERENKSPLATTNSEHDKIQIVKFIDTNTVLLKKVK